MEIHLDGERRVVPEGARLSDLLPDRDPRCTVALIRPAHEEAAETAQLRIVSTAGEIVVEGSGSAYRLPEEDSGQPRKLELRWTDRYAAAFGPFVSAFSPARRPYRYERGDVILGCGGYDPARSYLIFSKIRHTADHGAPEDGGVVGRVVSGRSVLDTWKEGDRILRIDRIQSRADRSRAVTTTDGSIVLEDGMHIVSCLEAEAEGFSSDGIDTRTAKSVEHLLLALQGGRFSVGRSASTHIRDERLARTKVPAEQNAARLAGTVTVRTTGKSEGAVYIYTDNAPASSAHTVVAGVTRGLELARLAREGDLLCIRVIPEKLDLIGRTLGEARTAAGERGIGITADEAGDDRVVVDQRPATTLEALANGEVQVTTKPFGQVIGVRLDDEHAPLTCAVFREVSGLKHHSVGKIPFYFKFEDVYLFKPSIARGVGIIPENTPEGVVPANSLAMTNDSRKGSGMVGVRTTESAEFGPTSEPFTGTNIIGTVTEVEKLEGLKEGSMVYIREVK
ncbi:hypothetical protein ABH15_05525 [Methanoculleus taiwanensis]|uniref:UPF0288 protein ABH15_05525 n=1 Tax=Methanoculleus taiwanensis TaxID=1550565 RepID=A0A498GYA7_9EURY|nr:methanogenesis marker 3 protein [Methanoculleus taiwanensis]RXE55701.1 hypothetical protein ABH15_05525 [Methanoculleus taiwanensis]